MGRLLAALPPDERARRYREFANDAMRKAQAANDDEQRMEYLTMASGWHSMALEIERAGEPGKADDEPPAGEQDAG